MHLQYGIGGIDQEIPCSDVTVLAPQFAPGLPDEKASFHSAACHPIECCPLRDVYLPWGVGEPATIQFDKRSRRAV